MKTKTRKVKSDLITQHKLPFLSRAWHRDPEWQDFKIGTCTGLWRSTNTSYEILAIVNSVPGNGHFNDVLQWFEHSCRRDKKILFIREIWNDNFASHLINKRGFKPDNFGNATKSFTS